MSFTRDFEREQAENIRDERDNIRGEEAAQTSRDDDTGAQNRGEWQSARARSLTGELFCVSNLIRRKIESSKVKQKMDNVTGANGRIIIYLYHNRDRDIFQKDIEKKFSYRRSTASSVIGLMAEKGLIERHGVPYDARLKKLTLTEKALELVELCEEDRESFDRRLRENISDAELDGLYSILDRLKDNLRG